MNTSFKPHIIFLEKKIARSVGVLAKLSYYLPCNTLIILHYSLVHTHLHYALPLWGATYKSNRAGQRCFELLALIGSPQLSFQRYSQLNKHLGLTGKPYWLAQRQML